MSYHVDPTSLLFDDLTEEEADVILKQVEDLVLRGTSGPVFESEAFKAWSAACDFDDRQTLLVISTAYPQRALLSLLKCRRTFFLTIPLAKEGSSRP